MSESMLKILQTVGLSDMTEISERENITPDIVSKLTRVDMQMLEVQNLQQMMQLRYKCKFHGPGETEKVLYILSNFGGAPKFIFPRNYVDYSHR